MSAGFVIYTDLDEVTTFEVHDGIFQWVNRYNFTYNGWMNIAMTWTWEQGIVAYINGVKQGE